MEGITKYFRYLKRRNPHLFKLHGYVLWKGVSPIPKKGPMRLSTFEYLHFGYLKLLVKQWYCIYEMFILKVLTLVNLNSRGCREANKDLFWIFKNQKFQVPVIDFVLPSSQQKASKNPKGRKDGRMQLPSINKRSQIVLKPCHPP